MAVVPFDTLRLARRISAEACGPIRRSAGGGTIAAGVILAAIRYLPPPHP
jgi:hypothetical protein